MPPWTDSVHLLSTGFERGKSALHARAVGLADNPRIHLRPGRGGNHVALAPAACHPHIYRHSPLQVAPAAHRLDHARQLQNGARSLLEVHPGVRGHSCHLDPPVANALAGGLAGQPLCRLQNINAAALGRQPLGHRPRSRAAHLLVARQQQHDLAPQHLRLGQHLEGGEGHGHARLHVQRAGPPEPASLQRQGIVFSVPSGQTVSRCPSSIIRPAAPVFDFGPKRASSTSPNSLCR